MAQTQRMVQHPMLEVTTRLFLSPVMRQRLTVLQFGADQLTAHLQAVAEANPFVRLRVASPVAHGAAVDWVPDETTETLTAHLLTQARLTRVPARLRPALTALCLAVDDDGYLRSPLTLLAATYQLPEAQLAEVLPVLQAFDPVGVGAPDLTACLLRQAAQPGFDPVAQALLRHQQLPLLATPERWASLPYTATQLTNALAAIRRLDPAPGHQYARAASIQYLTPDFVAQSVAGRTVVQVATDALPQLGFDQRYYDQLTAVADEPTKVYLHAQRQQYEQLTGGLERRKTTLTLIGMYLTDHQQAYLSAPQTHAVQPLTLSDCAAALGLAVSTISRAVRDKYLLLGGRLLSVRHLFVQAVRQEWSPARVQQQIAALIAGESPEAPLSDELLTQRLEAIGVTLSRRTVAKYRALAGLPNAFQRKAMHRQP
ncbi:hypothetical protein [Lacticaseibacillus absianus]|uniref:RNA polymerase factor sigma-54 n=1 Tax=Lacticaseibacillus absianus TaxID=2729623 RepID=UPI0015C9A13A|nr:hypothetical protein [Lacticaseibacillus absianus]